MIFPALTLLDEVRHLIGDRSPEDIARSFGYKSPGSIARQLHRLGEHDLAKPFDSAANRLRRQQRWCHVHA